MASLNGHSTIAKLRLMMPPGNLDWPFVDHRKPLPSALLRPLIGRTRKTSVLPPRSARQEMKAGTGPRCVWLLEPSCDGSMKGYYYDAAKSFMDGGRRHGDPSLRARTVRGYRAGRLRRHAGIGVWIGTPVPRRCIIRLCTEESLSRVRGDHRLVQIGPPHHDVVVVRPPVVERVVCPAAAGGRAVVRAGGRGGHGHGVDHELERLQDIGDTDPARPMLHRPAQRMVHEHADQ